MPTAPSVFWVFIAGMATVITPCILPIAYSGKSISGRVAWFVKRGHFFKRLSGMILILVGLMMLFEIDKYLKTISLPYFPVYI